MNGGRNEKLQAWISRAGCAWKKTKKGFFSENVLRGSCNMLDMVCLHCSAVISEHRPFLDSLGNIFSLAVLSEY